MKKWIFVTTSALLSLSASATPLDSLQILLRKNVNLVCEEAQMDFSQLELESIGLLYNRQKVSLLQKVENCTDLSEVAVEFIDLELFLESYEIMIAELPSEIRRGEIDKAIQEAEEIVTDLKTNKDAEPAFQGLSEDSKKIMVTLHIGMWQSIAEFLLNERGL